MHSLPHKLAHCIARFFARFFLTGRRVGPELPEPLAMSWDPSASLVAMAYAQQVGACSKAHDDAAKYSVVECSELKSHAGLRCA